MRVQHNIPAMNAYRNYTNNTKAINKNLEKLSSGYRINRAGDDAAGLAISEKMRAQITGLATAQKNAKDGISLVQTAEGALTEVHSMLNRMFELAEQSANGTYDNEVDRANLQKEFDALSSEIDRIADSSNFNGTKLLDGSLSSSTKIENGVMSKFGYGGGTGLQGASLLPDVGPTHNTNTVLSGKATSAAASSFQIDLGNAAITGGSNAVLELQVGGNSIKDATATNAIDFGDSTTALSNSALLANAMKLDGTQVTISDGTTDFLFDVSVDSKGIMTFTQDAADALANGHYGIDSGAVVGFTETVDDPTTFNQATINNVQGTDAAPAQRANTFFDLSALTIVDGSQLTIGDTTYTFAFGSSSKFAGGENVLDLTQFADLADTSTDPATGLTALETAGQLLSQQSNGVFTIGFNGTDTISVEEKAGQTIMDLSTEKGMLAAFGTSTATFVPATGKGLTLQIGDTAESFNQLTVDVGDLHCKALGIDGSKISIAKQGDAQGAMDAIKQAINSVSSTRGDLGALQNRLDHTINNLSVMEENIQDAESTIRDTDVAKEMMEYTKNNILIQSSQAMLAQANQLPQGVLQLLG